MPVDIDIDHVARLARLGLTAEEKERFREQLGLILEHAERVGEVAAGDAGGATVEVPPTSHPIPRPNVFREDRVEPGLSHQEAMASAPEQQDGRFKVPRVIEQEG